MAGKIFINYRREDSIGTAGRLHDRLAQVFGRKNLLVDVVGNDLDASLINQIAAFLAIISPNWLDAKDEAGRRRLDNPEDFVVIEIAAALAGKVHVVPVLVDGARMPKASELPRSLKPLARCQSIEIREHYFDQDVATLVEEVRAGRNAGSVGVRWRRRTAVAVVTAAGLLMVGWIAIYWMGMSTWPPWRETREADNAKVQAEVEAKRKSEEAEQRRLAIFKAEQERQARAAAEAEAKRKIDEAEQRRVAALRAEEEERKRAEAEAQARYSALISQGNTDSTTGNHDRAIATFSDAIRLDPKSALAFRGRGNAHAKKGDSVRAIADFNEAIRLDPKNALAFIDRGDAYTNKGDNDRAIADYNQALRLDPKSALAVSDRGVAYAYKGDNDRAIADFNEAIRLDPKSAHAFRNRGVAYVNKGDHDRAIADFNEAIRLDPKSALAFRNRGVVYAYKGDNDRAIADYNEAIRLDPKNALAFRDRGVAYTNKGDNDRAIADFNEAIRLDPNDAFAFCNRGRVKRNINDMSGDADIANARQLNASVCR